MDSKKVLAENLTYMMSLNKVSKVEICRDLGFKYSTFNEWCHARAFPRIEAIESMASYFRVDKSDLIEVRDKKQLLSVDEIRLIEVFRSSDEQTKMMIRRLLDYVEADNDD